MGEIKREISKHDLEIKVRIPFLGNLIIGAKRRQAPIKEFEELNKAGKALFDEIAKALRLKEICDFLEKHLRRIECLKKKP